MAAAASVRDRVVTEIDNEDEDAGDENNLEEELRASNSSASSGDAQRVTVLGEAIGTASLILKTDTVNVNGTQRSTEKLVAAKVVALEALRLLAGWSGGRRQLADKNLWELTAALIDPLGSSNRDLRAKVRASQ